MAAPLDVRAERSTGDSSIEVTWTAGSAHEVEYKVSRLTPDGRWQVVGRTGTTSIIDGAVALGAEVPVYGVVARLGTEVSPVARSISTRTPPPDTARPDTARPDTARPDTAARAGRRPESADSSGQDSAEHPSADRPSSGPDPAEPDGFLAVRDLTVSAPGKLEFEWPAGVTEAMVVVRRDRPPASPGDPAATTWKITNMRYQIDGGLLLPPSVTPPCHVAVASCRRERGVLVVAPGFGPSARATLTP